MPDRRVAASQTITTSNNTTSSTSTTSIRPPNVRRNLFHSHLRSSRPASSQSTSTSAETVVLDAEPDTDNPNSHHNYNNSNNAEMSRGEQLITEEDADDIVIRDVNGDFRLGGPAPYFGFEDGEEGQQAGQGREDEGKERQRLADAVKHHQRDRNRAPSEPAELLEAVRASLRAKVAGLAEDNWMYEAEEQPVIR